MTGIEFDSVVFSEKGTCIAYCPELDISSCGKDVDQARQNLKTAVRLFIEEAQKIGTLEQILEEAGYVIDDTGEYRAPRLLATETMSIALEK